VVRTLSTLTPRFVARGARTRADVSRDGTVSLGTRCWMCKEDALTCPHAPQVLSIARLFVLGVPLMIQVFVCFWVNQYTNFQEEAIFRAQRSNLAVAAVGPTYNPPPCRPRHVRVRKATAPSPGPGSAARHIHVPGSMRVGRRCGRAAEQPMKRRQTSSSALRAC
jgi:hypothetical protein